MLSYAEVKTYAQAEAYLNEIPKFTSKNPLENTKQFYAYIQTKESGIDFRESMLGKIIHVAGTNGKGSVCAFLANICKESGLKTGFFSSPHLVTTRERFQINGQMISEETFLEAFFLLHEVIESYQRIFPTYQPSYFERLFFMMLLIFSKEGVDVTVLETGLGGRLDTTNVIQEPALTVITEIGFDHMAYLGDTIDKIASEKAGIIKASAPVVFIERKKEATVEIEKMAKQQQVSCIKVSKNAYKITEIKKKSIDFLVPSRYYDYIGFTVNSRAEYQLENATLAIRAIEEFVRCTHTENITREAIERGISSMFWPGRMEEVLPEVYIDGAHNEDGVEAFVNTVGKMLEIEKKQGILLFSAVNDKRYENMIQMLSSVKGMKEFVLTVIPGSRGVDLDSLGNEFRKYTDKEVHSFEKLSDAMTYLLKKKGEEDKAFIVGSLYLAGLVEEYLENAKQ